MSLPAVAMENAPALDLPTDPMHTPAGPQNWFEQWLAGRLLDVRDLHFTRVTTRITLVVLPIAFVLFLLPSAWTLALAPFYLGALLIGFGGPYLLMLHAVSHRPLYAKRQRLLNAYIPWVLGPFFGQTPTSFYVHHVGMHHREDNHGADLSATVGYERDNWRHFLHYWARFMLVGVIHLSRYLHLRGRTRMLRQLWVGEVSWLLAVLVLGSINPAATFVVFVAPLLIIRSLFMSGNWGQHAFVDVDHQGDAYRHSTCLTNTRYNHRAYNDGYHIVHHLQPSLHWTEMAKWYVDHRHRFRDGLAVVFRGIRDNQVVFFRLMRHDYDGLAHHLVDLGEPRTQAERVAFLKSRTRRTVGHIRGFFEFESASDTQSST